MQGSPERARDLAFFLAKEFDVPFDGKAIGKTEPFFAVFDVRVYPILVTR